MKKKCYGCDKKGTFCKDSPSCPSFNPIKPKIISVKCGMCSENLTNLCEHTDNCSGYKKLRAEEKKGYSC